MSADMTPLAKDLNFSNLRIEDAPGSSSDEVPSSTSSDPEPLTADPNTSLYPLHQASRMISLSLPNRVVRQYLGNHNEIFRELDILREKGWADAKSEEHFEKLREGADNPDRRLKDRFYAMNKKIGEELHNSTNAFSVRSPGGTGAKALNLCMAPGGYTWYFLTKFPNAIVKGITLPVEEGGHPIYIPNGDADPRVHVLYMDITMLAVEFGTLISDVPLQHPEAEKFSADRPFLEESFELVVCDGQVLRTHRHERKREREALRLLNAQLILGLNRIKPGGTLIVLLHKVDAWDNIRLLQTLETFSKIRLYKPKKFHAARSSFYLIAKAVRSESAEAIQAIERWKAEWQQATFGGEASIGIDKEEAEESQVQELLDQYGARLMEHGTPIWTIQLQSMKSASFFKEGNETLAE